MLDGNELQIDRRLVKLIAKQYKPLDYCKKLIQLLTMVYPNHDFNTWEKVRLHELLNKVIITQYDGEPALKHALFKQYAKKNNIAAFEIKVKNSRVDFLSINGFSSCFEIKSGLDNLNKLSKQAADYISAFDYNYVVIDERHVRNSFRLVPECFGIWSFKDGKKKIHRDALLNQKIDSRVQLQLLTKKEVRFGFSDVESDVDFILKAYDQEEINKRFKLLLKARYQKRWSFIVDNSEMIFPADLQFFFNTNVRPEYVYNV